MHGDTWGFGGFLKKSWMEFFPFPEVYSCSFYWLAPGNNGIGGCKGDCDTAASMGFGILGKEYGALTGKSVSVNGGKFNG